MKRLLSARSAWKQHQIYISCKSFWRYWVGWVTGRGVYNLRTSRRICSKFNCRDRHIWRAQHFWARWLSRLSPTTSTPSGSYIDWSIAIHYRLRGCYFVSQLKLLQLLASFSVTFSTSVAWESSYFPFGLTLPVMCYSSSQAQQLTQTPWSRNYAKFLLSGRLDSPVEPFSDSARVVNSMTCNTPPRNYRRTSTDSRCPWIG